MDASNAMSDIFCKQATLDFIANHNSSGLNSVTAVDNFIKAQELTKLIEFVEGTKLASGEDSEPMTACSGGSRA